MPGLCAGEVLSANNSNECVITCMTSDVATPVWRSPQASSPTVECPSDGTVKSTLIPVSQLPTLSPVTSPASSSEAHRTWEFEVACEGECETGTDRLRRFTVCGQAYKSLTFGLSDRQSDLASGQTTDQLRNGRHCRTESIRGNGGSRRNCSKTVPASARSSRARGV